MSNRNGRGLPPVIGRSPRRIQIEKLMYDRGCICLAAESAISAPTAAAAEQKDDPDTAVIKATAIAASVMSPTATAAKEKDDPDQISASTGGSIVITSAPTVCSS